MNDLTHLQSLELPDSLDEVLSQEKQKTEYMKLKELKSSNGGTPHLLLLQPGRL